MLVIFGSVTWYEPHLHFQMKWFDSTVQYVQWYFEISRYIENGLMNPRHCETENKILCQETCYVEWIFTLFLIFHFSVTYNVKSNSLFSLLSVCFTIHLSFLLFQQVFTHKCCPVLTYCNSWKTAWYRSEPEPLHANIRFLMDKSS